MASRSVADRGHVLERLGERVRAERQRMALTLRELSTAAGVSERFLISVENGTANVSVLRLVGIANALSTDAATLLSPSATEVVEPTEGVAPNVVVSLLGLRGAGKSSIGRLAAERVGVPFIELDHRVEAEAGMSPGEIFELHGRDYYRRLERDQISKVLAEGTSAIVATAGSLVTDHENYELLRRNTLTIWLKAKPRDHMSRVVAQGDARPMANRRDAMDDLTALLRARRALYERARHVVDTSALGLERSVERVVNITTTARLAVPQPSAAR